MSFNKNTSRNSRFGFLFKIKALKFKIYVAYAKHCCIFATTKQPNKIKTL